MGGGGWGVCTFLCVPPARLERALSCEKRILSPSRLPIPPRRRKPHHPYGYKSRITKLQPASHDVSAEDEQARNHQSDAHDLIEGQRFLKKRR